MRAKEHGVSLVEVLVAMTIFSFGILGMLGMHARAIASFSDIKYRTDAALLTDSLINDIWVNRSNLSSYAYSGSGTAPVIQPWLSQVAATLPRGAGTVTVNGSTVQVTVTWQPPNATAAGLTHRHSEIATIQNP